MKFLQRLRWYPPPVSTRPPRYLFVCTANINRSPMASTWAEHYLTQHFVAGEIRSAGTHAWKGAEAGAYAIDAMREHGFDMRSHRSQPISSELLDWADHVVVMEPMHSEVVGPKVEPSKLIELWDYVDGADHIADPQGHPLEAFRRAAGEIEGAVSRLISRQVAERRAARAQRS